MNKYIYKSFAAFLALGFAMSSCSDFLEAENKSAGGSADEYFTEDPASLLYSSYESLKDLVTLVDINEHGTDLYINTRGGEGGVYNEYTLTPLESSVSSFYSNTYKTINYANGVISYAGAESTDGYEARFIRGYGYYLLTQQFGSVPYITTYINSAERSYPRTELATIYSSVIADLEEVYNATGDKALENKDKGNTGHASKQAVAALLAKFYLAAGWDVQTDLTNAEAGTYSVKSTDYFTKAAQWAEKAIDGQELTMSFSDKWSPTNDGNSEVIWSVQYDRASYPGDVATSGHSLQNNYGGYFGNVTDNAQKYTGSANQPSTKVIALWDKGDERYETTFMDTYYNSTKDGKEAAAWGDQGYYAYYNLDAKKLETQPIAFRFFPYYTTQAEVEAYLKEHKSQFAKYTNRAVNAPQAVRMSDADSVLVYTFKDDGSYELTVKNYIDDKNAISGGYINETNAFGSVKKYDDPESAQSTGKNDYRDIVIFHLSQMYLDAAEAYFMAGNTTKSLEYINKVRARAKATQLNSFSDYTPSYTTSNTFTVGSLDLILDERARETYAERTRWIDLRRTKQLIRYNVEFNLYVKNASKMANAMGEYKWLRPIPSDEISSNEGISSADQNPGY